MFSTMSISILTAAGVSSSYSLDFIISANNAGFETYALPALFTLIPSLLFFYSVYFGSGFLTPNGIIKGRIPNSLKERFEGIRPYLLYGKIAEKSYFFLLLMRICSSAALSATDNVDGISPTIVR